MCRLLLSGDFNQGERERKRQKATSEPYSCGEKKLDGKKKNRLEREETGVGFAPLEKSFVDVEVNGGRQSRRSVMKGRVYTRHCLYQIHLLSLSFPTSATCEVFFSPLSYLHFAPAGLDSPSQFKPRLHFTQDVPVRFFQELKKCSGLSASYRLLAAFVEFITPENNCTSYEKA